MAELRVCVAAPGVGKSTWCQATRTGDEVVCSTDAARAELGAGEHDQTVSGAAFELVERRAAAALAAGRTVTVDATGTRMVDRTRWRGLAMSHATPAVAIVLRCPLVTTLLRNHRRARRVPVRVVVRMWLTVRIRLTRRALLAEGFDEVRVVDVRRFRPPRTRARTTAAPPVVS